MVKGIEENLMCIDPGMEQADALWSTPDFPVCEEVIESDADEYIPPKEASIKQPKRIWQKDLPLFTEGEVDAMVATAGAGALAIAFPPAALGLALAACLLLPSEREGSESSDDVTPLPTSETPTDVCANCHNDIVRSVVQPGHYIESWWECSPDNTEGDLCIEAQNASDPGAREKAEYSNIEDFCFEQEAVNPGDESAGIDNESCATCHTSPCDVPQVKAAMGHNEMNTGSLAWTGPQGAVHQHLTSELIDWLRPVSPNVGIDNENGSEVAFANGSQARTNNFEAVYDSARGCFTYCHHGARADDEVNYTPVDPQELPQEIRDRCSKDCHDVGTEKGGTLTAMCSDCHEVVDNKGNIVESEKHIDGNKDLKENIATAIEKGALECVTCHTDAVEKHSDEIDGFEIHLDEQATSALMGGVSIGCGDCHADHLRQLSEHIHAAGHGGAKMNMFERSSRIAGIFGKIRLANTPWNDGKYNGLCMDCHGVDLAGSNSPLNGRGDTETCFFCHDPESHTPTAVPDRSETNCYHCHPGKPGQSGVASTHMNGSRNVPASPDCGGCHGNPPPPTLDGDPSVDNPAVGAHQTHLDIVDCIRCHPEHSGMRYAHGYRGGVSLIAGACDACHGLSTPGWDETLPTDPLGACQACHEGGNLVNEDGSPITNVNVEDHFGHGLLECMSCHETDMAHAWED